MTQFDDDANYDPNDPDNYADVGEMVRQVTGDDPDTPGYDDDDEPAEDLREVDEAGVDEV